MSGKLAIFANDVGGRYSVSYSRGSFGGLQFVKTVKKLLTKFLSSCTIRPLAKRYHSRGVSGVFERIRYLRISADDRIVRRAIPDCLTFKDRRDCHTSLDRWCADRTIHSNDWT